MFRLKAQRRNPPKQQRLLGVKVGDGFGSTSLRAPKTVRRRPAPPKKDLPPKKEEKFEDNAKESLSKREEPAAGPPDKDISAEEPILVEKLSPVVKEPEKTVKQTEDERSGPSNEVLTVTTSRAIVESIPLADDNLEANVKEFYTVEILESVLEVDSEWHPRIVEKLSVKPENVSDSPSFDAEPKKVPQDAARDAPNGPKSPISESYHLETSKIVIEKYYKEN